MIKKILNFIKNILTYEDFSEHVGIKGMVKYTLKDINGNIKDVRLVPNLITNAGFDLVCDQMGAAAQPAEASYIAVGTGTTAANVVDTTLETELGTRSEGTYAHTPGTKVYTNTVTYGAGVNTGAITESGMLNAAVAGSLLNRQVFDVINKSASDSLEIEWEITLS